jgi:hypothetical protein
MGSRTRRLMPALGVAVALVAGCSASGEAERAPGDPVTQADAEALAELLHRNFTHGGADFVVTAPYGDDVVLTLTGEVDFRHETGRAQAVTTFGDGRADDTRALFFTHEDLWVAETPGLTDALAAAGAAGATFLHRPLTAGDEGVSPPLVDVLLEVLLNLSSPTADDPRSFVGAGYTWEGQRSIDSRLTSLFGLADGRTVAVAATDDLLTQFVTPLAGGEIEATVTLSDHGFRRLPSPAPEATAEAADHQEIAAAFGM